MIVEGIYLDRRACARYGSWLAKLARAEYRRNATPLPVELATLLDELDEVGYLERTRSDATSATSETRRQPELALSAPLCMTTGEAARELGVSAQRVRKLCATGRLRADRVHGAWLLSRVDVADEVAARRFSYSETA